MKLNTYLGRGINDYLYAKKSITSQSCYDYNWPAVICAQSVEKILKAVIESKFADQPDCISVMRTHNLRTIVNRILTRYPESNISSRDCKWLGDFYFDARYPGDDFVEVTKEDAEEALEIVESTIKEVEKILVSDEDKKVFQYCKSQLESIE